MLTKVHGVYGLGVHGGVSWLHGFMVARRQRRKDYYRAWLLQEGLGFRGLGAIRGY